jgi:hypothetical protein
MTAKTPTPAPAPLAMADYAAAARRARSEAMRDLVREAARAVRALFSAPEASTRRGRALRRARDPAPAVSRRTARRWPRWSSR